MCALNTSHICAYFSLRLKHAHISLWVTENIHVQIPPGMFTFLEVNTILKKSNFFQPQGTDNESQLLMHV